MIARLTITALAMLLLCCMPAVAAAPKGAQAATLTSSDGHSIAAWYWKPQKSSAPAVIMLHMLGSDKSAYTEMAGKLVAEGYAAIAIDLRGHGESKFPDGGNPDYKALTESDFTGMLNDIRAAHDFLADQPEVDADRVAIIGASIGANLAIIYGSGDLRVRTVVALSAGQDYRGLKPAAYLERYGRRPLYLVCSKADKYSWESSVALEKLATAADPVSLRVFEGKAHGTNLLTEHEGLDDTIVSGWLLNYLPPKR
ncbi:MAG: alpha/beta fold hydrolase [Planctomycetales bacterium]|nr:alpha/beta fold hydrolase [bacterium]UNM07473.1 MAG: alpha/beta fold hydrolase [Planctomycetales bacterium]